jgi:hypothetical protein
MFIVYLFLILIFVPSIYATSNPPDLPKLDGSFYVGETYPKFKTKFEFSFPQCLLDSHVLKIERRDSVAQLESVDKGKRVGVRHIYLIGRLSSLSKSCSSNTQETIMKYEIESDKERMTHFIVFLEKPAKITLTKNYEQ